MNELIDPDGNVIRKEMLVMCDGDMWVVKTVSPYWGLTATLVNKPGKNQMLLVGRRRLRYVAVIGFQIPLP